MSEYCDNWIHSAIRYDGQAEAATLSDWCYSGLGPQWGPGEPQRAATPEQTARGQAAWKRMNDKARSDAVAFDGDCRQAALPPMSDDELNLILQLIKGRQDADSSNDRTRTDNNGHGRDHETAGHG